MKDAKAVEHAIIGGILNNNERYYSIAHIVSKELFSVQILGVIWEIIADMLESGKPVQFDILTDALKNKGINVSDGLVHNLWINSVDTPLVESALYLENVYVLNEMEKIASGLPIAINEFDKHEEAADFVIDKFTQIKRNRKLTVKPTGDVSEDVIKKIKEAKRKKTAIGLNVGLPQFNDRIGGLHPQDLWVIAAKPSYGKTTLALNIARHIGIKQKIPFGIISVEMNDELISMVLLSMETHISTHLMRSAVKLNDRDIEKMDIAKRDLKDGSLFVTDSATKWPEVKAAARMMVAKHRVKAIMIDYLQKITVDGLNQGYETVSKVSLETKELAKSLNIPILLLSQLSRAGELKSSSQIDQDADIITIIDWPWKKDARMHKNLRILNCVKSRMGEQFDVELVTHGRVYTEKNEDFVDDRLDDDILLSSSEDEDVPF